MDNAIHSLLQVHTCKVFSAVTSVCILQYVYSVIMLSYDTGAGDMLSLCCVHVTQSADSVLTANKYAESAGYYSLIESPVEVSSVVDGSLSVVEFDNTNPGIPVYKTVVVRNYRYSVYMYNMIIVYMYMWHVNLLLHTCTCINGCTCTALVYSIII